MDRVSQGGVLVLLCVEVITRSGLRTPSPVVVVSLSEPLVVEAHVATSGWTIVRGAHGEGVSFEVNVVEGLDGAAALDVGGLGGASSEHWHEVSLCSLLIVVLLGALRSGHIIAVISGLITVVLHPGAFENIHLSGLVGSSVDVRSVVDIRTDDLGSASAARHLVDDTPAAILGLDTHAELVNLCLLYTSPSPRD